MPKINFRLKNHEEQPEAPTKVKLTHEERQEMKALKRDFQHMTPKQIETFLRLSDPESHIIKQLTTGGSEAVRIMQKEQIWSSIIKKWELNKADTNQFLNSLTENEYTEFIKDRSQGDFE
jgi:hypothetical protein